MFALIFVVDSGNFVTFFNNLLYICLFQDLDSIGLTFGQILKLLISLREEVEPSSHTFSIKA
jgi:hypothetical protein